MAKTEGSGAFTPDQLHIIDCALKHLEANLILDQARREEAAMLALSLFACGFNREDQLAQQLLETLTTPLARH